MSSLVHATAVVVGTTGIVLTGPSGAGKSAIALRLMAGAHNAGHFAALVSDDQLFLDVSDGRLIATAPKPIFGMIELRGSGIGHVKAIGSAVMHLALEPITPDSERRIPEENQRWTPISGNSLPLYFIDRAVCDPFSWLCALILGFPVAS